MKSYNFLSQHTTWRLLVLRSKACKYLKQAIQALDKEKKITNQPNALVDSL